jgi:hypothetical protein
MLQPFHFFPQSSVLFLYLYIRLFDPAPFLLKTKKMQNSLVSEKSEKSENQKEKKNQNKNSLLAHRIIEV